jgi:hypothetical protein
MFALHLSQMRIGAIGSLIGKGHSGIGAASWIRRESLLKPKMRGNDALYATIYSLPVKFDDSSHTGFRQTYPVRCRNHLDQVVLTSRGHRAAKVHLLILNRPVLLATMSAVERIKDFGRTSRHVSKVPTRDSCTAANSVEFRPVMPHAQRGYRSRCAASQSRSVWSEAPPRRSQALGA